MFFNVFFMLKVAEVDADNEEAQTEARLHEGKVESHCTNVSFDYHGY